MRTVLARSILRLAPLGLLAACTSTITPPPNPRDPVSVFLLLEARHRGVVLPAADGRLVEYGYGDWDWYVLNEDAWYDSIDTVLWPGGGALGRRPTRATDGASLRAAYPSLAMHEFAVEREAMLALRDDLEAPFAARAAEQRHNPRYGMTFVPVDKGYWCLFNCNDATADWLERLGCEVSWVPIRLGLRVVPLPD